MDFVVIWFAIGACVVAFDCDLLIDVCEEQDGIGQTPFYVMWVCLMLGALTWPLFFVGTSPRD